MLNLRNKEVWGLSIPIMIEFMIGFAIPATDSFFLSRLSLENAIAVGAVMPILAFCDVFFGGLNTSAKSLASQALGRGEDALARKIFNYTLWMVFKVSIVILIVILLGKSYLVGLLGLEGNTAEVAESYLLVMGCGMSVLGVRFLFQVMNAIYGIVRYNIASAAIMLLVNIIGDAAIVYDWFGLQRFGVVGIALVSVLSVVCAIVFLIVIQLKKLGFCLRPVLPGRDYWGVMKTSSRIVIPTVIDPVSVQLFAVFVTAAISRIGSSELAVRIFSGNIFLFCLVPGLAMMITSQILSSRFIGSRDFKQAETLVYDVLKVALLICTVMIVPIVLFSERLIGIFTDDQRIIQLAFGVMVFLAIIELFRVVNLIIGSNLKSAGDGYVPTFVTVGVTWLMISPLVLLFGGEYGLYAVMGLLLLDELIKAAYNLFRWFQDHWQNDLVSELTSNQAQS